MTQFNRELHQIIDDLIDTMYASPGTIGLAAPQIGVSKRIFVCDVSKKESGKALQIFINPEITSWSNPRTGREGCLSLPDYTGNVARAEKISVKSMDTKGEMSHRSASGIEAICWQHEIDHLNGFLFIHRVTNLKTGVFRRKRYL